LKQKVALLEKENADLKALVPAKGKSDLDDDTTRVLVYLFSANDQDERDTRVMVRSLGMELSILKYHLDRLDQLVLQIFRAVITSHARCIGRCFPLAGKELSRES
jgi:hypothetical protein